MLSHHLARPRGPEAGTPAAVAVPQSQPVPRLRASRAAPLFEDGPMLIVVRIVPLIVCPPQNVGDASESRGFLGCRGSGVPCSIATWTVVSLRGSGRCWRPSRRAAGVFTDTRSISPVGSTGTCSPVSLGRVAFSQCARLRISGLVGFPDLVLVSDPAELTPSPGLGHRVRLHLRT
jgi:hypothetical protein